MHLYPEPMYDTIIEPFAGSARYALRHGARSDRNVILNDLDPTIYGIWKWLVEEATPERVAMWPELKKGERLDMHDHLTKDERALLGYSAQFGVYSPKITVSGECDKRNEIGAIKRRAMRYLSPAELSKPERDFLGMNVGSGRSAPCNSTTTMGEEEFPRMRRRVLAASESIKHWTVSNLPYWKLPNVRATWFIDPPYCGPAGRYYKYNEIDYAHLAEWCRTRKGQVIVCEGAGAHWLPFRSLGTTANGSMRSLSVEKVWTNIKPTPLFDRLCGAPATFDARDW